MIIKVWTTAEDTDYGTNSHVFATEQEAVNYLWQQVARESEESLEDLKVKYADDVFVALHAETDVFDTFNITSESLEIPLAQIIADTVKHQIAHIGRSVRSLRKRFT